MTTVPINLADQGIDVTTITNVSLERIAYTLCAALEGGSTYWCAKVRVKDYLGYEWAHEAIAAGAPFTFWIDEGDYLDEDSEPQHPKLTLSAALTKMANEFPTHFGDMVGEKEDAETGDILFQLLCFDELVYG